MAHAVNRRPMIGETRIRSYAS